MGPSTITDSPTPSRNATRRAPARLAPHSLATEVARLHGDALMRTARRYAGDPDDAHDAYQRALELLLEHAATIEPGKALPWMHVVVRREATALRRRHDRHAPLDIEQLDRRDASDRTDEHLTNIDLAHRASEALATLTDTEAQALCLRAQGLTYEEIADTVGWSYTKVNRAVTEGRRAFADHYLGAERGDLCEVTGARLNAYLTGELRGREHLRLRAHLTRCAGCRAMLHAEREADRALRALLPPAIAAAPGGRWLHDHLLSPLSDLATRLAPASEPALGTKLGAVALSTVALTGGGLTIHHERRATAPPPAIRSALAPTAASSAAATPVRPATSPLSAAVTSGTAIIDDARAKARAAARRKAAAKRAAERRRARATAASREFTPAATEFSGTPSTTGAVSQATRSTTTGPTGSPTTAPASGPIEVPADQPAGDTTTAVTETP